MPQSQAFALPLELDPLHGAFCEPLACCLHAVDLTNIRTGASVIVLGGGVIGLLTIQLARLAGATRILLVTRNADKRALAEKLGATATVDPSQADTISGITGYGGLLPGGADVVFECAGVPETMMQAPRLARRGGTAVILGVMPQGAKIEIEPFDLLFREVNLVSSFLNPFTHQRAADLIATGAIKVEPLISRRITLEQTPNAIANPAPGGEIRTLVIPPGQ
jgi:L-iditol 2-dehydrogenase